VLLYRKAPTVALPAVIAVKLKPEASCVKPVPPATLNVVPDKLIPLPAEYVVLTQGTLTNNCPDAFT
jgi:hypothetical protein